MNDRGQAFTVEGVAAALLLLGTLVFALQATGITALSAGTAGGVDERQQSDLARGVLVTGVASETLVPSLLYWNDSYVVPMETGRTTVPATTGTTSSDCRRDSATRWSEHSRTRGTPTTSTCTTPNRPTVPSSLGRSSNRGPPATTPSGRFGR
ncbi:hypothetical protein [Haloferax sp. ATB1]|uniref:DUF7288 family protein n=1 Tax=Haloferax sp. ATB1 TaxID=1508454 RepID=UPI000693A610|nr:hypothetical protein [Haloferax sp. ATB1]